MREKAKNLFVKIFKKKILRRLALILASILLIASVYSIINASNSPTENISSSQKTNYQHQGTIDYTVYLKANSLYETEELGPNSVFFTPLVDAIIVRYDYEFISTPKYAHPAFIYQADAKFGIEGVWQKKINLLPPTLIEDDSFSFSFALPLSELITYFDVFARETGSTLNEPTLNIIFQITPKFELAHGISPEIFTHQFRIQLNTKTIRPEENLSTESSRTISTNEEEPQNRDSAKNTQVTAGILGIIISLVFFSYLGKNYLKQGWDYIKDIRAENNDDDKDFRFAKKRLGGLFVETAEISPPRDEDEVIYLNSLRDLVNLADETLRPVLYQVDEKGRINFVILRLGYIRYEYNGREEESKIQPEA